MKKLLVLASVCVAAFGRAAVIFDNGAPSVDLGGWETTMWANADDITLSSASSFDTLRFWTSTGGAGSPNISQAQIEIFEDSGAVVYSSSLNVSSHDTGELVFGYAPLFEDVVSLGAVSLNAGHYWVSVYGDPQNNGGYEGIYYASTANNSGFNGISSYNNDGMWDVTGSNLAFRIENNATPEPATMAALAFGALALVRRRRQ